MWKSGQKSWNEIERERLKRLTMATIVEEQLSGGEFSGVMMVLTAIVGTFIVLFVLQSAVQQAAAGSLMTALVLLWGVFALYNRRRRYVVYRPDDQSA